MIVYFDHSVTFLVSWIMYLNEKWKTSCWPEVIQYKFTMWQDICWFKYFETTQKNLHWWEAILLFKWWEDIHTVKYFKRTWKKTGEKPLSCSHCDKTFCQFKCFESAKKLILGWSHSVVHIVTIHLPIEVLWNNMNELTLPLWDISCNTFSSWMASHQYESFHVSLSDLFVQMSCQNVNLWMAFCQCDSFMFFHTNWFNKCLVAMWTMEWLLASVSYFMLFKSTWMCKCLVTIWTTEWHLCSMSSVMYFQSILTDKCLVIMWTIEWLHASVGPFRFLQSIWLFEHLNNME